MMTLRFGRTANVHELSIARIYPNSNYFFNFNFFSPNKKISEKPITKYQLQDGEVLLPPQVLLNRRTESRKAVVQVHDDVYEGVDHSSKHGCKRQGKMK